MDEDFLVMRGENLEFADGWIDAGYPYGVLQYVDGSRRVIDEARGVLRPTGEVIFMVYKTGFVDAFKLIPKFMNRRFGQHIMVKVTE